MRRYRWPPVSARDDHRTMMEFDPLSLYTPQGAVEEKPEPLIIQNNLISSKTATNPEPSSLSDAKVVVDDENDAVSPIHHLDLPPIQQKPPREVLSTFLRLLAPEEVHNFTHRPSQNYNGILPTLQLKGISIHEAQKALEWLHMHSTRFATLEGLLYIPTLSSSLKSSPEYNAWLARVVSSGLSWIPEHDDILKEATLRLSENCGRTAQPEIIRKIDIPNLSEVGGVDFLQLREPSLTGDNLGLKTWGSSLILAERLVKSSKDKYLRGTVLELGSGTGLVGMVSGLMGFRTFLTDLEEIVPNLQNNVELNAVDCKVLELDWRDPSSFRRRFPHQKFQTIILSDPIYSTSHPQWVFNMINEFMHTDKDSRVLLQIPLRPQFEQEREKLWSLMGQFTEQESSIEDGYDDFGAMKYSFKLYTRE